MWKYGITIERWWRGVTKFWFKDQFDESLVCWTQLQVRKILVWLVDMQIRPHTHPHHLLSHSRTLSQFHSLSLLRTRMDKHPKTLETSRIVVKLGTIVFVKLKRVDWYPFQVRIHSKTLVFHNPRLVHCSCTRNYGCFWEFEACWKLNEVPRKLGVLRLKVLDVGIMWTKFG